MAHIEPKELPDRERIFMARTLRQARKVEDLLTESEVDYVVQVEPYGRSLLFGTIRHGAAFYVCAAHAAHCRQRLVAAGFAGGIIEREPAGP